MLQVNIETNYLPKFNRIARDCAIFSTKEECKKFIEYHKSLLNENGLKRTKFVVWEIKKEVNEIPLNEIYDK